MAQARCMANGMDLFSPYRVEEEGGWELWVRPNYKSFCERPVSAMVPWNLKLVRDRCGMHRGLHVQDFACKRI